jgi:acyl carrier protein
MSDEQARPQATSDVIRSALLTALNAIQTESGRSLPVLEDSLSLESLDGFDSWAAEEAVVLIEAELGVEFPGKFQPFFDESGELRTLGEAVAAIELHLKKSERSRR